MAQGGGASCSPTSLLRRTPTYLLPIIDSLPSSFSCCLVPCRDGVSCITRRCSAHRASRIHAPRLGLHAAMHRSLVRAALFAARASLVVRCDQGAARITWTSTTYSPTTAASASCAATRRTSPRWTGARTAACFAPRRATTSCCTGTWPRSGL